MLDSAAAAKRRLAIVSAQVCASPERLVGPSDWNVQACTLGGGGSLTGKTLFITGASRGIGLAIARRAGKDGANVAICAKTAEAHKTLPGTIHTAAKEIDNLGGKGLACIVDVRNEDSIAAAVKKTVETFGGIDILVNCASAIFPTSTETIDIKKLNLMWEVTTRAPLLTAKHCIPYLKASAAAGRNPHILTCSPPVDLRRLPQPPNPNYMVCKMGMSVGAIAMSEELRSDGIAANTMWPAGAIATSAVNHLLGNDPQAIDDMFMANARTPEIQADAAYLIFTSESSKFTGNMTIDEDVLSMSGVTDFAGYDYAALGATREERLAKILNI